MEKTIYETPCTSIFQVKVEGKLLSGSVETMRTVTGSWDEDEEEGA